jgi:hypothetical protein
MYRDVWLEVAWSIPGFWAGDDILKTKISNMAAQKERDFKTFYLPKYLFVFAQEHVNFRFEVGPDITIHCRFFT